MHSNTSLINIKLWWWLSSPFAWMNLDALMSVGNKIYSLKISNIYSLLLIHLDNFFLMCYISLCNTQDKWVPLCVLTYLPATCRIFNATSSCSHLSPPVCANTDRLTSNTTPNVVNAINEMNGFLVANKCWYKIQMEVELLACKVSV